MAATLSQFQGCLLGLSLGDALGAPFEGGILERAVWRAIGRTRNGQMRWTDDTQMAVDLGESFLAHGKIDPDDLATRFARSYRWSRGYGSGTAKLLRRIARGADWREANRSVYRDGSFGNGAAMRAPILGVIYADRIDEMLAAARLSGAVTHAHALGIEGAVLLACATAFAARGCPSLDILEKAATLCASTEFRSRLETARMWLESGGNASTLEVARVLGNGIAAHESCVTGVYLALRFREQAFVDMQQFIAAIGGDVDTIGAMAGAVWGAVNGVSSLPAQLLEKLEQRERLMDIAAALHDRIDQAPMPAHDCEG